MLIKGLLALLLFLFLEGHSKAQSLDVNVTISIPQETQSARLYNFESRQFDRIPSPQSLTREQCLQYLPPMKGQAIKLFDLFIAKGKSPYRALTLVHFKIRNTISNRSD